MSVTILTAASLATIARAAGSTPWVFSALAILSTANAITFNARYREAEMGVTEEEIVAAEPMAIEYATSELDSLKYNVDAEECERLCECIRAIVASRPAPLAANDTAPALPDSRADVIAFIRENLKRRSGKAWSVTGGTGTAYGWIRIQAPPARRVGECGYTSPEDCAELAHLLGQDRPVHMQGEGVSPDGRSGFVRRLAAMG